MRSLVNLALASLVLLSFPAAAQAMTDTRTVAQSIAHQTIDLQDRDHDGRISLKESAGAALILFGAIDTDRSQLISAHELLSVAMNDVAALKISNSDDQTRSLVQARFQTMDIDGDNEISLPEMLAVTEMVFEAADRNADGFVSEDELSALAVADNSPDEAR